MNRNTISPRNGSRTNWQWPRRASRRAEALIRQAEYDGLTTERKIALCATRTGESKRELARLRESN